MTDKHYDNKRYPHKKKLKSKFANGFRNIFHQQKPIQRSSSVPTHLDDTRDGALGTLYPRITYDIDISDEHLDKTDTKPIPIAPRQSRPSSAYYGDFGSANDICLSPEKSDALPTFPKNHGWRKSLTSLDVFRKDKGKPNDLLKAKHKISIYDNVMIPDNKDVVIANSPSLHTQNDNILPDANNNTDQKHKNTSPQRTGTSDVHSSSSLESVKEVDTASEHQLNRLYNGHADPNKGIRYKSTDTCTTDVLSKTLTDSSNTKRRGILTVSKAAELPASNKASIERTSSNDLNSIHSTIIPTSPQANEYPNIEFDKNIKGLISSTPRPTVTRSLTEEHEDKKLAPVTIPRTFSDDFNIKRRTMGYTIEKEKLQTLVEDVIEMLLSDKQYDAKLVTRWCKEICIKVRDRLLRVKELRHKIVVNAHIAAKLPTESSVDTIFVATRCQKDILNDRFITVALEGKDLYVWVTVLLVKYR